MRKLKNLLLTIAMTFTAISFANTDPVNSGKQKIVKEIGTMLTTPNFEIKDSIFNVVFTVNESGIIKVLRVKDETNEEIKLNDEYVIFIKDSLNGKTLFSATKKDLIYFLPIKFKQLN